MKSTEREDNMLAVTETIKELLKLKNISQVELAEKLGMSKQNINNKFKRNTFSPEELVKIAEILGMKLAFVEGNKKYFIESSIDIKEKESQESE